MLLVYLNNKLYECRVQNLLQVGIIHVFSRSMVSCVMKSVSKIVSANVSTEPSCERDASLLRTHCQEELLLLLVLLITYCQAAALSR